MQSERKFKAMLRTNRNAASAVAVLLASVLGAGGLIAYHALAQEPAAAQRTAEPQLVAAVPGATQNVLDKYRSFRPLDKDLAIYQLDWVATLPEAKAKAAQEQRPILLIVVTNSYGNMYTGHC
jgi:hypothetical protein